MLIMRLRHTLEMGPMTHGMRFIATKQKNMKIIHTADWHIGNTFYEFDRADEHRHFFEFLLGQIGEHNADALVVSGDVFDNPNPSAEAQRIYYDFLSSAVKQYPGLQIVVIAGNHDSAARLEASSPVLEDLGVFVRGCLHTDSKDNPDFNNLIIPLHARNNAEDTVVCLAVPFLRAADLPKEDSFSKSMGKFFKNLIGEARKQYGKRQRMILAAHFYATGSEISSEDHSERIIIGGEENVDASKFCEDLSYVALGHIHKAQRVAGLEYARYSGSALPMSFGERGYKHGVNVVNIDTEGNVTLNPVEYRPLRNLLTIPQKGTATPQQAIAAAESLAKAGKNASSYDWPYVEIRLSEDPDSATMHSIKESYAERAALLCIVRNPGNMGSSIREIEVQTEAQLQQLDPLNLAKKEYGKRNNGTDMPQELIDKFNTAKKIAEEREAEQ